MNLNHTLLCSAAAIGLSAASACGGEADPGGNEPTTGDRVEEAAEDAGDFAESAGEEIGAVANDVADGAAEFAKNELSQTNAKGFTVRNVLGAVLRDAEGDAAAVVEDILFDDARQIRAIVVRDDSVLGVGGETAVIGARGVDFNLDNDREVAVSASLTEDAIEAMTASLAYQPKAGVADPGDLVSIRQFMDQPVRNRDGDEIADPFDIILGPNGDWRRVILSVGGLGAFGNRLVAVDPSDLDVNAATGVFHLVGLTALRDLPTFEYD